MDKNERSKVKNPREQAGFLSIVTFKWVKKDLFILLIMFIGTFIYYVYFYYPFEKNIFFGKLLVLITINY